MKKKHTVKSIFRFNMIEVALAMAVITLGITGVLALLPVSLQNSNDARNDELACEAAANIMEFVKILHKNGKIETNIPYLDSFGKVFAAEKDDEKDRWTTDEKDFQDKFPYDISDYTTDTTPNPWLSDSNNNNIGPELYFPKGKTTATIFRPLIYCDANKEPLFHVRMFYTTEVLANRETKNYEIMRVYIEVSWPVRAIYKSRLKRIFIMEFPKTTTNTTT